jgi:hypothetical protein
VTNEDILAKGSRLANQMAAALRDADIEVIGSSGGSLVDVKRGGTFATGNVTLSALGADKFVQKLTGSPVGSRDARDAVRSALFEKGIGGLVSRDPVTGDVGLAQPTEGVVEAIIEAVS